ncbi:exostosin domain-containing protein [Telluria beijingensis]|uniref:exostosin domain-containing protein n=1 Tax=Telluria beijingensis TaxID=3068633 RepID=UPI002795BC15|nr:exostosin family protein [Massilia sp. REN29]
MGAVNVGEGLDVLNSRPLHSFWFKRFQVFGPSGDNYLFRDVLMPPARGVARSRFAGLAGRALEVAMFQAGFAYARLPLPSGPVRDKPRDRADTLFWQYPCVTEGAAWEQHAGLDEPTLLDGELHVYLGLPWATWIDFARKAAWPAGGGAAAMAQQLQMTGVRLSGLRGALGELGIGLRVHTVCQHIYWRDMEAAWRRLGVTDAWLSHCPPPSAKADTDIALHPWALFAVNARDAQRRAGIVENGDPATKTVLASFTGAHAGHYLSDTRLRLRALDKEDGFVVRVTDRWHFEQVVYGEQIGGEGASQENGDATASYNALLSDSVFSLCPAGAGANTLRLWESLAVGAVPVLCGPQPMLPVGGSLPAIDWDRIVVRVPDEQIAALPSMLRAMPISEVRERQQRGLRAYAQVIAQRCF